MRLVIAMFRFLYSSRFVSETAKEGVSVQSGSSLVSVETAMTSHMPPHTRKAGTKKNNRGWHPAVFVSIGWIVIIKKTVRHSFNISSPHEKSGKLEQQMNPDLGSKFQIRFDCRYKILVQ